jgi:hypothetical protein
MLKSCFRGRITYNNVGVIIGDICISPNGKYPNKEQTSKQVGYEYK